MSSNTTCRRRSGALIAPRSDERNVGTRKGAACVPPPSCKTRSGNLFGLATAGIVRFAAFRVGSGTQPLLYAASCLTGFSQWGDVFAFCGLTIPHYWCRSAAFLVDVANCFTWHAVGDRNVAAPIEWPAFSGSAIAFSGVVFIAMAQKAPSFAEKAVFFDKIAISYAQKAMPEAR